MFLLRWFVFQPWDFLRLFWNPFMLRRPFDIREVLLGLLAIAGISIVFHFDPHYKLGIIISLFSALLASIFPVLNRQILQKMDAETATRYQLSGGFLFITLLMPVYLYYFPVDAAAFPVRLGLACSYWVFCVPWSLMIFS